MKNLKSTVSYTSMHSLEEANEADNDCVGGVVTSDYDIHLNNYLKISSKIEKGETTAEEAMITNENLEELKELTSFSDENRIQNQERQPVVQITIPASSTTEFNSEHDSREKQKLRIPPTSKQLDIQRSSKFEIKLAEMATINEEDNSSTEPISYNNVNADFMQAIAPVEEEYTFLNFIADSTNNKEIEVSEKKPHKMEIIVESDAETSAIQNLENRLDSRRYSSAKK